MSRHEGFSGKEDSYLFEAVSKNTAAWKFFDEVIGKRKKSRSIKGTYSQGPNVRVDLERVKMETSDSKTTDAIKVAVADNTQVFFSTFYMTINGLQRVEIKGTYLTTPGVRMPIKYIHEIKERPWQQRRYLSPDKARTETPASQLAAFVQGLIELT